jgi:hypothetical protein
VTDPHPVVEAEAVQDRRPRIVISGRWNRESRGIKPYEAVITKVAGELTAPGRRKPDSEDGFPLQGLAALRNIVDNQADADAGTDVQISGGLVPITFALYPSRG